MCCNPYLNCSFEHRKRSQGKCSFLDSLDHPERIRNKKAGKGKVSSRKNIENDNDQEVLLEVPSESSGKNQMAGPELAANNKTTESLSKLNNLVTESKTKFVGQSQDISDKKPTIKKPKTTKKPGRPKSTIQIPPAESELPIVSEPESRHNSPIVSIKRTRKAASKSRSNTKVVKNSDTVTVLICKGKPVSGEIASLSNILQKKSGDSEDEETKASMPVKKLPRKMGEPISDSEEDVLPIQEIAVTEKIIRSSRTRRAGIEISASNRGQNMDAIEMAAAIEKLASVPGTAKRIGKKLCDVPGTMTRLRTRMMNPISPSAIPSKINLVPETAKRRRGDALDGNSTLLRSVIGRRNGTVEVSVSPTVKSSLQPGVVLKPTNEKKEMPRKARKGRKKDVLDFIIDPSSDGKSVEAIGQGQIDDKNELILNEVELTATPFYKKARKEKAITELAATQVIQVAQTMLNLDALEMQNMAINNPDMSVEGYLMMCMNVSLDRLDARMMNEIKSATV